MNKKNIKFDYEGYLKNFHDWNKKIAYQISKKENILMNEDHWKIIYFLRNFYLVNKKLPKVRIIIESVTFKFNHKYENSIYLFTLYPKGVLVQASKIAGIPKSINCF